MSVYATIVYLHHKMFVEAHERHTGSENTNKRHTDNSLLSEIFILYTFPVHKTSSYRAPGFIEISYVSFPYIIGLLHQGFYPNLFNLHFSECSFKPYLSIIKNTPPPSPHLLIISFILAKILYILFPLYWLLASIFYISFPLSWPPYFISSFLYLGLHILYLLSFILASIFYISLTLSWPPYFISPFLYLGLRILYLTYFILASIFYISLTLSWPPYFISHLLYLGFHILYLLSFILASIFYISLTLSWPPYFISHFL